MRAQKSIKKMNTFRGISRSDLLVSGVIISIGVASRLIPHLDNFSPVFGLALFAGFYFRKSMLAWLVPLAMIIVSDVFLGMYAIAPIIWLSYVLMALGTRRFMKRGTIVGAFAAGIAGSVLFYIVTNFAVWSEGRMYAMSFQGLVDCYIAALPFFRPALVSAVLYSVLMFGGYRILLGGRAVDHVQALATLNQK